MVAALCLLLLPAACHAQQTCAWLNAATAGGFLEGDVTSTVTPTSKTNDDMTCEFVRQDAASITKLRIEVDTVEKPQDMFASYVAKCKDPAPIHAVGNEAMICSRKEKHHETTEHLVGRVRDRIFLLDITSNAPHPDEAMLREKAERISQQVAGILF
jgi:hypothetical protein